MPGQPRDGSGQNPTQDLTQPEAILANPTRAIFLWTWATRRNFFTNPKIFFSINVSKFSQNWLKKWEKTWPKHNFMNPNQNSLTRDPTRVRSHNPKPDPRAEKRTRPIPTIFLFIFVAWSFRLDMSGGS